MATYTVYVPSNIGGTRRRAERTIFIREGFSLAALVFGPFYLLSRRLWLAALGWIVIAASIAGLSHALALSGAQSAALVLLLSLLTGFEATLLRQVGLQRRGYEFAAMLTGTTLEQAERAFFNGEGLREARVRQGAAAVRTSGVAAGLAPDVIGSFPQTGGA